MGLLDKLFGGSAKKSPIEKVSANARPDYRSVQILPKGGVACDAVLALNRKRILVQNTPKLPLDDCDQDQCQCVYRRFDDRRGELRRTADVAYDIASQIRDSDLRSAISRGRRAED